MDDHTWMSKLDLFKKSAMKKISKKEFDKFVLQAHIFGKPEILEQILTSKKKKNRYFEVLDQCFVKLKTDESSLSAVERGFILKIGNEKDFLYLMETEAKKYGITINNPSFPGFHLRAMSKLKDLYDNSADREIFEQRAKEILRYRKDSFCYKVDFVYNLSHDPTYAYYWSKYIKLKRTVPQFIRNFDAAIFEADAERFVQSMKESILIFGVVYTCHFVSTLKALEKFIQTCFKENQLPQHLAINVKVLPKNGKILFLTLASKNWVCIIDFYTLFTIKKLNYIFQDLCEELLEYIYDPVIDRIGFNFESDYNILTRQISDVMELQERKGLCLKKLIENILKNSDAENCIFWIQKLKKVNLSNVAKALLKIELDEDDDLFFSLNKWKHRPLYDQQKISLLKDTVILFLLKDKIESDLKWTFGESDASKMDEEGHVQIGINLCQYFQCTNCHLSKCVQFPSSLYVFLHHIYMAFIQGYANVDWNQFRNDFITFKQTCTEVIDLQKAFDIANYLFCVGNFKLKPLTHRIAFGSTKIRVNLLFGNPRRVDEILSGFQNWSCLYICLNCLTLHLSSNYEMHQILNDGVETGFHHLSKGEALKSNIFAILNEVFSR